VQFAPFVYVEHDANGKITRVDGICYQMVVWLAAKYNFTYFINLLLKNLKFYLDSTFFDFSYTFVEPSDGLFGSFVNGSWNGMIQQIINGVTFFQNIIYLAIFNCYYLAQKCLLTRRLILSPFR